jgi:hypothetical protein
MKRLIPFLALIVACQPTPDVPASDTVQPTAAPQSAEVREPDPTPAPVADADSVPWNRYPRVLANMCIGETCSTKFPAVACREVRLRTAPSDDAPLDVTVALKDTVNVTQTDIHLEAPGVVVFRRAYVHDSHDVDGEIKPASDTLRFAAGDTLYLLRYYSLGSWLVAFRDKKYDWFSDGFWYADSETPGLLGSSARDSSVAVARSYPKTSTWWHVALEDGRRGFWKFDMDAWREGLKPEGKYWEVDCP